MKTLINKEKSMDIVKKHFVVLFMISFPKYVSENFMNE